MKKVYPDEIVYSHGAVRSYHLSRAGKIVLHIRICEIDRYMMTENSENEAKVMEVPPNFFICLDDNIEILFRRGIPMVKYFYIYHHATTLLGDSTWLPMRGLFRGPS